MKKTWKLVTSTTHATPGIVTALSGPTRASRAIVQALPGNTDVVSIGPDLSTSLMDMNPGDVYNIPEASAGDWFDLSDWKMQSPTASQGLRILKLS